MVSPIDMLGDVQELARQQSPEAINTLVAIMQNEKAAPAARVAAANSLLVSHFAALRLRGGLEAASYPAN